MEQQISYQEVSGPHIQMEGRHKIVRHLKIALGTIQKEISRDICLNCRYKIRTYFD
jgi:hypothetical protein